ncbi:MAG: hypothetical protein PUB11_07780 [Oscillospiraceae bacterium]|nr:hypothetical protein [Oscillospiraceae bacterium]
MPVCVVWDFEFLPDEQATLTRDVARRYAVTERENKITTYLFSK